MRSRIIALPPSSGWVVKCEEMLAESLVGSFFCAENYVDDLNVAGFSVADFFVGGVRRGVGVWVHEADGGAQYAPGV